MCWSRQSAKLDSWNHNHFVRPREIEVLTVVVLQCWYARSSKIILTRPGLSQTSQTYQGLVSISFIDWISTFIKVDGRWPGCQMQMLHMGYKVLCKTIENCGKVNAHPKSILNLSNLSASFWSSWFVLRKYCQFDMKNAKEQNSTGIDDAVGPLDLPMALKQSEFLLVCFH